MAQAQQALEPEVAQPLTLLSEEERLFAASVREFAEAEVKPYVREMDEKQKMRPEIGEEYGGSGGSFFMACLAIEE